MKPLAKIGYGSGQPVGFPDYKPINAWGRMPKPVARAQHHLDDSPRYQLEVTADGKPERVGPKAGYQFVESLFVTVNAMLLSGEEKVWSSPRIVRVERL